MPVPRNLLLRFACLQTRRSGEFHMGTRSQSDGKVLPMFRGLSPRGYERHDDRSTDFPHHGTGRRGACPDRQSGVRRIGKALLPVAAWGTYGGLSVGPYGGLNIGPYSSPPDCTSMQIASPAPTISPGTGHTGVRLLPTLPSRHSHRLRARRAAPHSP